MAFGGEHGDPVAGNWSDPMGRSRGSAVGGDHGDPVGRDRGGPAGGDRGDPVGRASATGPMGTRAGDEDHGLVEDPGAARRNPRPPMLRDLPDAFQVADGADGVDMADRFAVPDAGMAAARGTLPATVPMADQRALDVLRGHRRGFRLGFGATAGACLGALALYLVVLNAGDRLDGALAEALRTHGGQIQATLADWLRRVVAPALS